MYECKFTLCHVAKNLCNDAMEDIDEDEVKHGRRRGIQADFEKVVVVRSDTEAGHEAVHHQLHVLTAAVLTARERLRRVEQQ